MPLKLLAQKKESRKHVHPVRNIDNKLIGILGALAQYDCQIHLVAHPRKGANEKQSPGKMDVKGSGALSDLADNVFAVWRNKGKSVSTQYDCKLSCDKHRNGDWEGEFFLWFDKESFLFSEKVNAPIKPYIANLTSTAHTEG